MRVKRFEPWYFLVVLLSLVLIVSCGSSSSPVSPRDAAQQVARAYVLASPTYVFDGIPETLKLTGQTVLEEDVRFTFTFEFDSRHAGYGDRTGQVLAQVITHHRAYITVEGGSVVSANLDNVWNMETQTAPGKI